VIDKTIRHAVSMENETQVERVLVVTAHPDDVDFGTAGSVATWDMVISAARATDVTVYAIGLAWQRRHGSSR